MRIPRILTAAAAAVLLAPLTGVLPAHADAITLTVDYGADAGPSNQVASGFLHGIEPASPAQYLIDGVKVVAIRGADHHPNLPSLFDRATYNRAAATGAKLRVGLYYASSNPSSPDNGYWPGDGGNWDRWRTIVNRVYDEARTNGYQVDSWITWNEPEAQWSSTARPFTTYLTAHDVAYDTLKARDPGVKIEGPELSSYNFSRLTQFLTFCKQNNCLPDVLSWHELTAAAPDVPGHTAQIRQWMIDNGITPMPITITEYQGSGYGNSDAWDPGVNVRFLAQFERSVPNGLVDALDSDWDYIGSDANFRSTLGNTADKATGTLPKGLWWNYNTYKDMTGRLVRTTSSAPTTVDALTAVDSAQRRSVGLIGNQNTGTHTVTLNLRNIPSVLQRNGKVHLSVTRFDDLGVLTNPAKVLEQDYTVSGNSTTVTLPALPASASLRFDVSPVIGGSAATVYEAESLPVTSTAGVVRRNYSESGASGGQASALESTAVGQSVTYTINVPTTGVYALSANLKREANRGFFQLYVDGRVFGPPQDEYGAAAYYRTTLGHLQLTAGQHNLEFRVVGKNASSSNRWMVFDRFEIAPLP
ncbi:UNVERIFIED_ORG: hypothetical protein FHR35_007159 [Microbispora rosea subsp. rosea]